MFTYFIYKNKTKKIIYGQIKFSIYYAIHKFFIFLKKFDKTNLLEIEGFCVYSYALRVAHFLWTDDQLKTHLIKDKMQRKTISNDNEREPFSDPIDLKKIMSLHVQQYTSILA